ncbi:MAG: sigma-54-dependent Fis family transcriptional regulator [Pseudomonadales bacterium]|nr:sigma-54-dependent Fis family transcriptional regulator [Pseudomonadales bacterium]MBI26170.1 sigma-54-dependent Fis family transcriptional regulator [Pseudomonadales bacterium]MEC8811448.1 sigma-54 dependent transcriptional regulator [Pseudomonadota bacterium]HAG95008.1 sigma-54-dependent Fis family transcriptional regulator [Gammaproteobacteria bacterium]HBO92327.1 sigma-54-dependent Fis family transcriptional regulator [Gammaproteobacteria bacterium]|tara:strand:- start:3417 stop:4931 length:1515 start_codon:yes stop_codon:yes gene_type:complete
MPELIDARSGLPSVPKPLPTVLILDDEQRSVETLARILQDEFDVHCATTIEEAEAILQREWVQIILCDQRMPEMTGVEFLMRVREQWPEVIRMIISGYTDSADIIDAVNDAGIYHFITKPWQPADLLMKLHNAARLFRLQRLNEQLSVELKLRPETLADELEEKRQLLRARFDWNLGIVRSPDSAMNHVCEIIQHVAPFNVNVLLTGESGTGKELCARALHYNSLRQDGPFVAENCGALPDELLESELFGHKRGAFTGAVDDRVGLFERADGGTIFLDEIGEVSPAFQVKLLRVLQEGEIRPLGTNTRRKIDVRVVAATNRDLEKDVKEGRFRQDLYYRLATFVVQLPPLRDRAMDIEALAYAILEESSRQLGKQVKGFTEEAIHCLQAYDWPGNVRELQNEIKRMLVLAHEDTLGADLISARIVLAAPEEAQSDLELLTGIEGSLKQRVESLEARILKETLIRHRWNKTRAAEELGLSRVGLRNKLERYELEQIPQKPQTAQG